MFCKTCAALQSVSTCVAVLNINEWNCPWKVNFTFLLLFYLCLDQRNNQIRCKTKTKPSISKYPTTPVWHKYHLWMRALKRNGMSINIYGCNMNLKWYVMRLMSWIVTNIYSRLIFTTEPNLKVSMQHTPSTFHGQIFSCLKDVTPIIRYISLVKYWSLKFCKMFSVIRFLYSSRKALIISMQFHIHRYF